MSSSHLNEQADYPEELDHDRWPRKDDEMNGIASSSSGSDDEADDDDDPQALQDAKVQEIFDQIRDSGDRDILVDGLDLYKRAEREKFMEVNRAYVDKETTQKKRNLLHLFADEMSEPRFATKTKRLKKLIQELVRLPANLLAKKDAQGNTPVHSALIWGNARLVRYMCEAHDDANSILRIPVEWSGQHLGNCLHLAMTHSDKFRKDRTELLDLLIKKSEPDTLCAADAQGFTPLHLAVDTSKCDDAQLTTVRALVDRCDQALDIMCKYRGKSCVSPYRYHVLTKEVLDKQRAETEAYQDLPAQKSQLQPTTQEVHTHTLPTSSQTDQLSTSINDLPLTRKPNLELGTKVGAVMDNTTPPLTPDTDERKPIKKRSRSVKAEPTEAGILAVGQYLKEYCLRTRDHDEAVELLYGPRQEKQIYFDLNGASENWTKNGLVEGFRHLDLEDVLQYVALPRLHVEEEIPLSKRKTGRPPKPDENGRTDLKTLFNWLKGDKKIQTVLRVIVDDLQEPSHRDEIIESCFEGIKGVETWDWQKYDVSPEVIQEAVPDVKVVHLYWSGNNAVLRAWSDERGIRQLKQLETVHLHSKQGLESKSRMQKNIKNFKSDVEAKRLTGPQIKVKDGRIQTEAARNDENGTDSAKNPYEQHKWVATMEEFAEFLQNAENAAEPQLELPLPVKVALIDDGVDFDDPVIQSKVYGGRSFCRDEEKNLNQPYYVSGGGNGTAMASYVCKVCPNARLYVLRLDEKPSTEPGRRNITAESAAKAIMAAIEEDVDIICMPWTIDKDSDNDTGIEKLEIALHKAAQQEILMFCAAADQGAVEDTSYPAATSRTKNIFKIGAAEASGQAMTWLGDDDIVDFIFPGHQVVKERSDDPSVREYTALTGSTVSAALASGLAALMLYCVQLSAIASSQGRPGPDLSRYQSLKSHQNMKEAFHQIGTTNMSKNKYITVWKRFEKPVRDAGGEPKDTWIDYVVDLANALTWDSFSY